MKRTLLHLALWLLLGVVAGFFGMYWMKSRDEKAQGMWLERATIDYYAKAQYKYADHDSARQALLYDIQVFNQMKGANRLWSTGDLVSLSDGYGELSLLEESSGNPDLARTYMVQAVQAFKEAEIKAGRTKPSSISEASIRKRLGKEPFVLAAADGKPQ